MDLPRHERNHRYKPFSVVGLPYTVSTPSYVSYSSLIKIRGSLNKLVKNIKCLISFGCILIFMVGNPTVSLRFIMHFTLQSGGGFTLVDFSIPTREVPISHPGVQAPLCDEVSPESLLGLNVLQIITFVVSCCKVHCTSMLNYYADISNSLAI